MPSVEKVRAFIAMVEAGEFVAAMEEFYHRDATMQENLGRTRSGLDELIAGEKASLERFDTRARKVERFAVEGDHVFINWVFDMPPRDGGRVRVLDEVSVQTWRGEKIVAERFYYDPRQMAWEARSE